MNWMQKWPHWLICLVNTDFPHDNLRMCLGTLRFAPEFSDGMFAVNWMTRSTTHELAETVTWFASSVTMQGVSVEFWRCRRSGLGYTTVSHIDVASALMICTPRCVIAAVHA